MESCFFILLIVSYITMRSCYPRYQSRIPNGDRFAYMGHIDDIYYIRNQFGIDFENNGHIWNITLCSMDSDRDGRTNGFELGDPNCLWPERNPNPNAFVTHPGRRD